MQKKYHVRLYVPQKKTKYLLKFCMTKNNELQYKFKLANYV